jgi:hypothetical protein
MSDTKYDVETLNAMVGEHGGKPPKLTLNGTVPRKPMSMKTGIGNGRYVGINFGEQWNDEAFEAVKANRIKSEPRKKIATPKVEKGDADESNS